MTVACPDGPEQSADCAFDTGTHTVSPEGVQSGSSGKYGPQRVMKRSTRQSVAVATS
jgi:hypothetical protein